jgi:hypothetical protein
MHDGGCAFLCGCGRASASEDHSGQSRGREREGPEARPGGRGATTCCVRCARTPARVNSGSAGDCTTSLDFKTGESSNGVPMVRAATMWRRSKAAHCIEHNHMYASRSDCEQKNHNLSSAMRSQVRNCVHRDRARGRGASSQQNRLSIELRVVDWDGRFRMSICESKSRSGRG